MIQAAPGSLGEMVDAWVYALVGASGGSLPPLLGVEMSWSQFLMLHVVRPLLYYMLLMPPILTGMLWLDASLKQRVLLWYRLDVKVKRVFGLISGTLAVVLVLVIVPVLNHLIFPEIYSGWSLPALVGMAICALALVTGAFLFLHHDRALSRWCPGSECQSRVPGDYRLGATCEKCGAALHGWLVATYQASEPLNC